MWRYPDDDTQPVFTAKDQLLSAHRGCRLTLPETAMIFFMGRAVEYVAEQYGGSEYAERFPRFLNRCPIWKLKEPDLCFLDGGRGAPQAADTVETLAALGVKTILCVGMFGAFSPAVSCGEIIAPRRAYVEEGTSLHYCDQIEFAEPDAALLDAARTPGIKTHPIVSTDAVYRQTFYKEALWREKGAVGVDMETSAAFSVGKYLGLRVAALLMASDVHPLAPDQPKWDWKMTDDMRRNLCDRAICLARGITNPKGTDSAI